MKSALRRAHSVVGTFPDVCKQNILVNGYTEELLNRWYLNPRSSSALKCVRTYGPFHRLEGLTRVTSLKVLDTTHDFLCLYAMGLWIYE